MGYISNLLVKLGLDNSDFNTGMDKSTRAVNKFGSDMESAGTRLTVGFSLPLLGVGAAALVAAGKMEQNQVAFTTLLRSADAAKAHLEDLKKFALVTPFQFDDLTRMSRLMQAFGTSASDVVPRLRTLGNAVSALGGGNDVLERVVRSMGEIGTRGKITGEQLRELSRAGIPALDAIAAKLGTTVAEAQAKVTAGMVDAQTATTALLEYMDKRFAGGMEAQSKTLLGAWSNIKDKLTFTLVAIGDALLPWGKKFISETLDPLLGKVQELAEKFKLLPQPVQDVVLGFGALAVSLPVLVIGTGMMITNGIVIFNFFSKLVPLLQSLAVTIAGPLIAAVSSFATWLGTLGAAAGGAVTLGLAAIVVQTYRLIDAMHGLSEARADVAARDKLNDAALGKLEASLRSQGIAIDYVRKQYDAGNITFYTYLALLKDLAEQHRSNTGATKEQMTAQQALDALNLRSTAQRVKDLEVAKEAYATLKRAGEGAEVLSEASLKVQQAQEALSGSVAKVTEKFKAFYAQSAGNMLLTADLQGVNAEFGGLIKHISDVQAAWKGLTGQNISPGEVLNRDLDRANAELNALGDEGDKTAQQIADGMGLIAAKGIDAATSGIKALKLEVITLPPELQKIKDAMDAFGLSAEKTNVADLTDKLGTLKKAVDAGEISQRSYDLAFIKYIEDLNSAGEAIDAQTIKEYQLAKARTQQLQQAKKDQNEFQREVQRTFDSMARGLAANIVDWKGWKDTVINVGKDFAKGFLEIILKQLMKPLEEAFAALVGKITNVLFGTGGNTAGGGVLGTSVGAAGGAAGTLSKAGSSAGGAASSVGGLASAGASSLSTWVNGIASVGQLISSVIANFQNAKQETSLNAIEHNTRYSMMYLGERSDGGILGVAYRLLDVASFGTGVKVSEQMRDALFDIRNQLGNGTGGGGKSAVTVNFYGPVTGNPQQIATAIFDQAALAGYRG